MWNYSLNHPVSQRRQGPGFYGVQGCGGNRKLQTPTPWEHEGSDQLAGLPPLRGGAPGWKKGTGKWGEGVKLKQDSTHSHKTEVAKHTQRDTFFFVLLKLWSVFCPASGNTLALP